VLCAGTLCRYSAAGSRAGRPAPGDLMMRRRRHVHPGGRREGASSAYMHVRSTPRARAWAALEQRSVDAGSHQPLDAAGGP
jgi:hypothetical protein